MGRAAVLAVSPEVDPASSERSSRRKSESPRDVVPEGLALQPAVDELERKLILRALVAADDNKAQAARLLGISERTLWYKLKRDGLCDGPRRMASLAKTASPRV